MALSLLRWLACAAGVVAPAAALSYLYGLSGVESCLRRGAQRPGSMTIHEVKQPAKAATVDEAEREEYVAPAYASRYSSAPLPRYSMPMDSMPKDAAYQFIHDELMLDGNPHLNLASFVTTWMEPECDKLLMEGMNKNFIDMDEYEATTELQNRCVNMIARLCNAPIESDEGAAIGVGTVGSSEAIMLAGLAFKVLWKKRMMAKGKKEEECLHPNVVCGANVQVCWEKFCRYWEVDMKIVKLTDTRFIMDPKEAVDLVDENTICVCAILGSTYDGQFEDVKAVNDLLTEKNKRTGWDTPIHVDAASGGFVAPFLWPELEWDFRLPLVKSINLSGHKYGLVYPGCGWAIWRSKEDLPEELVFHINYLGSDQPTFTLNFSRGATGIIGQYYQFIRLGFHGYKKIMANCWAQVQFLRERIEELGIFKMLSSADMGVPLLAFTLKDDSKYDCYDIAHKLRMHGWILPAYTMAPDASHVTLLRAVVREDFSRSLAYKLAENLEEVIKQLEAHPTKHPDAPRAKKAKTDGERIVQGAQAKALKDGNHAVDDELRRSRRVYRVWKTHGMPRTTGPC
eukprot:jgi/Chlat1/8440/Chrsp80S07922